MSSVGSLQISNSGSTEEHCKEKQLEILRHPTQIPLTNIPFAHFSHHYDLQKVWYLKLWNVVLIQALHWNCKCKMCVWWSLCPEFNLQWWVLPSFVTTDSGHVQYLCYLILHRDNKLILKGSFEREVSFDLFGIATAGTAEENTLLYEMHDSCLQE